MSVIDWKIPTDRCEYIKVLKKTDEKKRKRRKNLFGKF